MRRSFLAGIGVAAVLIFAACTPDQTRQEPLAPGDVGLAKGGGGGGGSQLCASGLLSDISKLQKVVFTSAVIATHFDPLLNALKNSCPTSPQSLTLQTYLQKVVDFRLDQEGNIGVTRAQNLVKLWKFVTTYAVDPQDAPALDRPYTVLLSGTVTPGSPGIRAGGAAVLNPSADPAVLEMTTFDQQAGVKIGVGPAPDFFPVPQSPSGPHLITMDPAGCPSTTLRLASLATQNAGKPCYEVDEYPAVTLWSPAIAIGMCIFESGPAAITHVNPNFGTEVLPTGPTFPWAGSNATCIQTHSVVDSWLGRKAGPLGRALAHAIDYLRPQTLFADDAGESGLGLFTSPFGGALTVVYEDGFTANTAGQPLANGTDPVVGDFASSWFVDVTHPGSITIQNGLGNMTGNVVVISQGQGACTQCPTVKLVGTRINPSAADTIGSYSISWTSLQNKPSVKEGPFVVYNFDGVEIARVSYVTEMSNNVIRFNGDIVGTWATNVSQDFVLTVYLKETLSGPTQSVSLSINGGTPVLKSVPAATTVTTFGYVLTGIDAGIIAADNFIMKRNHDIPPP
jgi:hypothetical protein